MISKNRICVVGAGLAGAVVARELAEKGAFVLVIDERDHVAGNCHTYRDAQTGIMLHKYGPHIFHTSDFEIWSYVNRFADMMPFINRVKAVYNGAVYSLPINLHTINQFFHRTMSPAEAYDFLHEICCSDIVNPSNFEEQGLRFLGRDLYHAFFHDYTKKQWGVDPKELPASILKRLPVRFDYNDNYYNDTYQAVPREGYTVMVEHMLDHEQIDLRLNCSFASMEESFEHCFFSGPIDSYFNYDAGRLGYRTLDFAAEYHEGDYQGNAVINYANQSPDYTRITEHKHLAPWEKANFLGSGLIKSTI